MNQQIEEINRARLCAGQKRRTALGFNLKGISSYVVEEIEIPEGASRNDPKVLARHSDARGVDAGGAGPFLVRASGASAGDRQLACGKLPLSSAALASPWSQH